MKRNGQNRKQMTKSSDIWRIYYDHWSSNVNPLRKRIHLVQCAQRIHNAIASFFDEILHVMSSQDTEEEKIDVFCEMVLPDPFEYMDSLEELSDALIHQGKRINNHTGCHNFEYLLYAMGDTNIMQILWAHDIWDLLHLQMTNPDLLCEEEQQCLEGVRSADAIVCLF